MPRIEYLLLMAYLNGRQDGIDFALRVLADDEERLLADARPTKPRAKCPGLRRA